MGGHCERLPTLFKVSASSAEELRLWCDSSGGGEEEEEEVHANPPPETRTEEEVGVI